LVNGVQTDVMTMSFSDKIMVTISQAGRLAHWVRRNSLNCELR
jgi:proteasome assembly chaperone 3